MPKHLPHGQARRPLSFHYEHERGVSPLPHEGSHSQGQAHEAELAPHSSTHPMQPRDRAKVHSGEKM